MPDRNRQLQRDARRLRAQAGITYQQAFSVLRSQTTRARRVSFGPPYEPMESAARNGGFQAGDLILLSGKSGVGKTAWILERLAAQAACPGRAAMMLSVEVRRDLLAKRLMGGLGARSVPTNLEIVDHVSPVSPADSAWVEAHIAAAATRAQLNTGKLSLVCVDALGLLSDELPDGELVGKLKRIAVEHDILLVVSMKALKASRKDTLVWGSNDTLAAADYLIGVDSDMARAPRMLTIQLIEREHGARASRGQALAELTVPFPLMAQGAPPT